MHHKQNHNELSLSQLFLPVKTVYSKIKRLPTSLWRMYRYFSSSTQCILLAHSPLLQHIDPCWSSWCLPTLRNKWLFSCQNHFHQRNYIRPSGKCVGELSQAAGVPLSKLSRAKVAFKTLVYFWCLWCTVGVSVLVDAQSVWVIKDNLKKCYIKPCKHNF